MTAIYPARIALALGIVQKEAEPGMVAADARTQNPQFIRKELGLNQLAWCKQHIPHFRASKRDADRAIRHSERVSGKVRP